MDDIFMHGCQSCFHSCKVESPAVELVRIEKGDEVEVWAQANEIVFLLKGECLIECDCYPSLSQLGMGTAQFLPLGCHLKATTGEGAMALVARFGTGSTLCANYAFDNLSEDVTEEITDIGILPVNGPLKDYIAGLYRVIANGVCCSRFMEIKLEELLFILRSYYSKASLAGFFRPILTRDMHFTGFVLKNWRRMKSAKEFSEYSNYSEKAFFRKFKQTFGVAPYKWLNDKRAQAIYHDLRRGALTFMQLCDEYHLNSLQQLNYYCKKNFGLTPGEIRRGNNAPKK